ncbi:hypothetical protein FQN52_003376 [Onygenales sp. PD_12]|nr:hypothetical protein FQN51_001873 [Onygenales sp. PD_10]KAK2792441.1 hypothetical protein FQN52_003376 [Onygenales sp. PD_12]
MASGYFNNIEEDVPTILKHLLEQARQPSGLLSIIVFVCCLSILRQRFKKSALPYPPGPSPLPVIGNIHQAPITDIWKTYKKWHDQYGPIISFQMGQKTIISLGSFKTTRDLLEKRSAIYSSRPHLTVANYIHRGLHTVLAPFGDLLRSHQALHATILNPRAAQQYESFQNFESKQLLHELLPRDGEDFVKVFRRYTYSTIATISYSKRFTSIDDEGVQRIERIATTVAEKLHKPSSLLLEAFPIFDYLPYPLAPWKQIGNRLFHESSSHFIELLNYGLATPSTTTNWAKQFHQQNLKSPSPLSTLQLSFVLASLFEANSTTDKVFESFVLAAALHPECISRAYEEIIARVGLDRLPQFSDMEHLPYTHALICEILRWRTITPTGVPHSLIRDDEYMGYRLPADATVIANAYTMELDENIFPDPHFFKPERFLEGKLPYAAFGFGKRACPGQHVARRSLFIVISRVIWGFNISHALDEKGSQIEIDSNKMVQSALSGPAPFRAWLKVRSERQREVIEREHFAKDGPGWEGEGEGDDAGR